MHHPCTFHQIPDVVPCCCNRNKPHRSKHRKTTAYIVRNDKTLISFGGGELAKRSLFCIGNRHNEFSCIFYSHLFLQVALDDPESNGWFSGGTGLGDHHYPIFFLIQNL